MCVEEGVPASDVILAAHQRHLLCGAVEQQQHTPLRVPVAQLDRFVLLLVALQCKYATPHLTRATLRPVRVISARAACLHPLLQLCGILVGLGFDERRLGSQPGHLRARGLQRALELLHTHRVGGAPTQWERR